MILYNQFDAWLADQWDYLLGYIPQRIVDKQAAIQEFREHMARSPQTIKSICHGMSIANYRLSLGYASYDWYHGPCTFETEQEWQAVEKLIDEEWIEHDSELIC
jgi:hypothetical protein